MAGRGPAPKDPSKRARSNADPIPATKIPRLSNPQPPLPDGFDWHPQTQIWWQMWADSPQGRMFTATDWSFLLDTALMHSAMWSNGQWTLAAEVRLRVAKFGATPEDRARLRMVFADDPDEGEDAKPAAGGSSRARRGGLRAV